MNREPTIPEPAATSSRPATDHLGEDTKYCRRILGNLLDIGNEMAEILARQIRSQTDNPEAAQATVTAYATLAQSVRRTVMLHEKLDHPSKNTARRIAARKRIIRDVEDAIERNAPEGEQEKLHAEFLERLDRPDLDDEIADRSIAAIVADITRDLGLSGLHGAHPWKRRIPHDITILNARAEQRPGGELAALLAAAPPRPAPSAARYRPLTPEIVAAMSDEELEARLKQIGPLPDS
jgi:hypothetical protein